MAEGVDYSHSKPNPDRLVRAGKSFAVRYVGTPASGKSLTAGEVAELRQAGVEVVATYETTAGFMLTADGASAARAARTHAASCGMPSGRPIYFALDVDPAGLSTTEWGRVERFLDDAAGVLGRGAVGVYGAFSAIERLVPNRAHWGWQTYAWSHRRWSDKAHLTQYKNGVDLAGGTVDLCASKTTDYGQWGRTEENDMDQNELRDELASGESRQVVKDIVTGAVLDGLRKPDPKNPDRGVFRNELANLVADELKPVVAAVTKLIGGLPETDVNEEGLAAALAPKLLVALSPEAIAAAIPDTLAREVAEELAARLAG